MDMWTQESLIWVHSPRMWFDTLARPAGEGLTVPRVTQAVLGHVRQRGDAGWLCDFGSEKWAWERG